MLSNQILRVCDYRNFEKMIELSDYPEEFESDDRSNDVHNELELPACDILF